LTSALLARGTLAGKGGAQRRIHELVLMDILPIGSRPVLGTSQPINVRHVVGDVSDSKLLEQVAADGVDSVFALGATLTSQAEADFSRGLEVNLHGILRLLEACRLRGTVPRFVFTSSIAAFGGPLPETVGDGLELTPQTSYGTHKAMGELALYDYSRHRFVDGRALRLPIVLVRPGAPQPAISDRLAALIREPLKGQDAKSPWHQGTIVPVASARSVAANLMAIHDLPPESFDHRRALNLCSVSVSIGDLLDALPRAAERHGLKGALGQVTLQPEPSLQAIVDAWPRRFESERARALGLVADVSIDAIIDRYLEDNFKAARK
jgi:D-erythronate 2-dehydrogenase